MELRFAERYGLVEKRRSRPGRGNLQVSSLPEPLASGASRITQPGWRVYCELTRTLCERTRIWK